MTSPTSTTTSTGARCTQPGCTGTISDGYCDVCGMAAGSAPAPTASPAAASAGTQAGPPASGTTGSSAASLPTVPPVGPPVGPPVTPPPGVPAPVVFDPNAIPEGGRCRQPGCTGTIEAGYCNVCGTPADQRAGVPVTAGSGDGPDSTATAAVAGVAGVGPELSTRSAASSNLASAALGSKRARESGSIATRRTGGSQRLRSARLGGGITTVRPAPQIDAERALLTNPSVPEGKRFCPKCGEPVGRGRDGKPGRTSGFCANCRQPFSFEPKLRQGDLVAGQYEVAGCLAHGGLGWIYLARDKNVSDRWVVLKGLLNSADPDALAAAIAEQRFLAQVSHPSIVEIYNFVTHDDAGYIVMEYVGGTSLKSILKQRMQTTGRYDPLPVDQALAYLLEILPSFQYLHDLGLVYCDFKPDNIIQVGDEVKLIDLGGVRRADDDDSAIFGTVGYQAPEVAELGVSVASDIYTIGRTLVVLTMEFRGYQSTYLNTIPAQDSSPVFQRYDSFYRLVAKACAPNRDDRFVSADELRSQMVGVLREVVAIDRGSGAATSTVSSLLFESPTTGTEPDDWRTLPNLRRDPHDPQTGWLQTVAGTPGERLATLDRAPAKSTEVLLEMARTALEAGKRDVTDKTTTALLAADPWEWRAVWIQGLAALERGDARGAQAAFNAVYGQVPGELAPKLALAHSCEKAGDDTVAENLYTACARTDATYVPMAAFGLARVRGTRGDIDGAVSAYRLVPPQSSAYRTARAGLAELLTTANRGLPDLAEALRTLDDTSLTARRKAELTAQIYREALAGVETSGNKADVRIGEHAGTPTNLRLGLESALRELARRTPDLGERVALVDEANTVRPWSIW
ncbi:serine/threonine-protein kinase [Terracoccus luteus]|uniref:non-specific serine/threonine protein kinase n=1 Tax=Terracoccus luteus TaxID=53356 RepID=A0A839PPR3_9MICO|nr:serine/threonine-protein kinase [Terracoccus luteus]MBB2986288.1 serine/threonine-protein kinase PknG [Terracoccus luteus]MCP2172122.1 serine/threonine-protein kinase PknG [Terracoccus luteus]